MKKKITFNNVFVLAFLLNMIIFVNMDSMAQAVNCPTCSDGTEVKFEWDKDKKEFILDGTDANGISISNVLLSDPPDDDEAYSLDWTSAEYSIESICFKHSLGIVTDDITPGVGTGTLITPDKHAIDHVVFCVSDELLPVEMTSFSVTISNNLAQLNWETATEVNNYGFEIQRSTETTDWNKIGFVNGHGNSNSPKLYSFTDNSVTKSGDYFYRLKQIDIDGTSDYSDVVNINLSVEEMRYKLNQNYPNPFNPTTTISYTIPEQAHVDIIVYNIFGEEITRLVNETKEIGTYSINFNAENLAAGLYFYTIQTESYSATKKLILLK